jgi:ABC-type transport system involved in multi-copper enzyme maturation permease subunit
MKELIIHEIQSFLYGLRFPIALSIVLVMFIASPLIYISEHKEMVNKYNELTNNQEQKLRENLNNATKIATNPRTYQLAPGNSGFISDNGEMNMPNTLVYTAFHREAFETSAVKSNPFILPSNRINWSFIILVLFGFLAIIFSFDTLSGERERRTLALCLSNPVKRSLLLISKFIAINALLLILALIGTLASMIILMLSPAVHLNGETFSEIGLFLLFIVFFTGSMTAIGMFTSVMCRNSNMSLLFSVSLWLAFLIAVPNFSKTIGMMVYPVERENVVLTKIANKQKEIEASFPDGKWSSNRNEPFFPRHKIRAEMFMAFDKNRADFSNEHLQEQFLQLEKIRQWTWISPLAVFEYGTEALIDGGYVRLKKNYDDLRNFKTQYLQWFKDFDASDSQSPHWYNPSEDYSTTKKAVTFEEVPQYKESFTSIAERLSETLKYLMIMIIYMGVMLVITLLKFEKYNVL